MLALPARFAAGGREVKGERSTEVALGPAHSGLAVALSLCGAAAVDSTHTTPTGFSERKNEEILEKFSQKYERTLTDTSRIVEETIQTIAAVRPSHPLTALTLTSHHVTQLTPHTILTGTRPAAD